MKLSDKQKSRLNQKYGPWAIVTGASSGIGLEIAVHLASAGLNLVINGRNEIALQELKRKLNLQHNIEVKTVVSDVSNPEGVEAIISVTEGLEIGLLVVSAGFGTSGAFIDSSIYSEVNMLRVNCEALLSLTHYYSQQFVRQKRGGIILMSSMLAFQGVPYSANYAATKAYVQSLAEGLAEELRPHGVDVLAAAPGPVDSNFGKRANLNMSISLKPSQVAVPILRSLGRTGTVLPGLLTKFLVYSLRLLPRWGKIRVMQKVMSGFTKHQTLKVAL
jgi:uncharacterized protein